MAFTTTDAHPSVARASQVFGKPRYLRGLKSIAVYLGVSEKTALRYIQNESLPAGKVGGGWEAEESRLDTWRQGHVAVDMPPANAY